MVPAPPACFPFCTSGHSSTSSWGIPFPHGPPIPSPTHFSFLSHVPLLPGPIDTQAAGGGRIDITLQAPMNSLAPPPPNEKQLWFQRPRCGGRGGEQDGARGQSKGRGQSEGMHKAELGGRRGVTDLGKEKIDLGRRQDRQIGERQDGWFRPDLEEGMGQTWRGKETGTGRRRSKSWGRGSEKHWTDGGDGAEKRAGERMRQSRERVWSSSLELEALEQEVVRQSPDRGPRDLEVTAAAAELTTRAPAACVRACLHVGGSASVCTRVCLCETCETVHV